MDDDRAARVDVVVAASIAALALIVFAPAVAGPFLWDDDALIVSNTIVHSLSHAREWFTRDFWGATADITRHTEYMRYYRPLVTASYALDWRLGGGDPTAFHITNLIAHAAVSVMVYFALLRWGAQRIGAAIGALVFAVHPSKAESVAWISGRTDVLCTLAMLIAAVGAARRFRKQRYGLALEIVGTVLAYLTKEGAVLLPALVAVEWWALERRPIERLRPIVVAAAPQTVVALLYLAARAVFMPIRPATPGTALRDHALFFFESIGRYVGLALGVHPYSSQHALLRSHDARWVHAMPWAAFGAVALVALLAVAVMLRRRAAYVSVGIALFFALLLPVSNIVINGLSSLVAERFLYAPLLGLALIVAHAVDAGPLRAAAIALMLVATGRTFVRSVDFSDPVRFWTRELALHPESIEPRRFLIAHARREHRYRSAASLALDARTTAREHYRHNGSELEFVVAYVEIASLLTPDRDAAELRNLDGFLGVVSDPLVTAADLRTRGVDVKVLFDPAMHRKQAALRGRIALERAAIESRLGDDVTALHWVESAERECPSCSLPLLVGAVVAARHGDYPLAYRFLDRHVATRGSVDLELKMVQSADLAHRQAAASDGPIALNLRAHELAVLEAWGRGYAVLAPYRAQIEAAPGFALGFAELAYRAGETEVALEVARKQLPEEKIAPTLAEWSRRMGWTE